MAWHAKTLIVPTAAVSAMAADSYSNSLYKGYVLHRVAVVEKGCGLQE